MINVFSLGILAYAQMRSEKESRWRHLGPPYLILKEMAATGKCELVTL